MLLPEMVAESAAMMRGVFYPSDEIFSDAEIAEMEAAEMEAARAKAEAKHLRAVRKKQRKVAELLMRQHTSDHGRKPWCARTH